MNDCTNHENRTVAAFWLMMGDSQSEAAIKVHRTARTVYTWQHEPCWPAHQNAAADCWMTDVIAASRSAVLGQIREGDGNLALKILERVDHRLAPATNRVDIGGPGGAGLTSLIEAGQSARERIKVELAVIAKRQQASRDIVHHPGERNGNGQVKP